jgi:phage baseplate assembly protein W
MGTVLPENVFDDSVFDRDEGVRESLTYDMESGVVIDNTDAMIQAIKKILITEYGSSEYYIGEYGIILEDLIGSSPTVVRGILSSRVREALMKDDRIENVTDFVITQSGAEMTCTFTVITVYGNLEGNVSVTTG